MSKDSLHAIKIAVLIFFFIICAANHGIGFDEEIAHPEITRKGVEVSNLNEYLKTTLGFSKGVDTRIPANSKDPNTAVIELLKKGSTDEDSEPCRRANHFHNPLLPWGQSGMSDDPMWATVGCAIWTKYSAVTWATGYLAPDGPKQTFPQWPDLRAPNNWDNGRNYYYLALTSGTNKTKKTNFADDWRLS